MAADPELRELALSIVNGLTDINEQPEPPDRVAFVRTLIWNFFYGANGRLAKEKVDAAVLAARIGEEISALDGPPPPKVDARAPVRNSCNRHDDCSAARVKAVAAGRNPYIICCHDENCEDCFGS